MKQERVSYKEAQNIVCENCGHYMSTHVFMETEMSNTILDEKGKMKNLSDKEVEEIFECKPGDKVVVTFSCKGVKGKQALFKLKKDLSNFDDSCDCDDFVASLR